MTTKFCGMCERKVAPERVIGVGTILLALCTAGTTLLLIPFYKKRCPICKGKDLSNPPTCMMSEGIREPSPETQIKCPDCQEYILKDARVCKHCRCRFLPSI